MANAPHLEGTTSAGPCDCISTEATRLTIKVSSLEQYAMLLQSQGAELLDPIQKTPVGRKMRYRHADGLIVEYVQHDG
jgi:hypothetical protein